MPIERTRDIAFFYINFHLIIRIKLFISIFSLTGIEHCHNNVKVTEEEEVCLKSAHNSPIVTSKSVPSSTIVVTGVWLFLFVIFLYLPLCLSVCCQELV